MSAILEVYAGSKYKPIFKFSDVDWCKYMNKKGRANPALKLIVQSIKSSSPQLLHECPYFGRYPANITIPSFVISLFPKNVYKFTLTAKNEYDSNFFQIIGLVDISSK